MTIEANGSAEIEHSTGNEDFQRARELGERGAYIVLHPHTREHMDVVDFDIDNARRREAGLSGYDFWTTKLPKEVDKQ